MEAAVDADERVHVDDDDLDREVEAVEAGAAVVPCGVVDGAGREVGADAEAGAESEEQGREEEDPDLGAEAAAAELVDAAWGVCRASHLGEDDADDQEGDGEEGSEGAVGSTYQLDVAVDAVGVGVKRVALLNNGCDQSDEEENNDSVVGDEEPMHYAVPTKLWMARSENSLRKEEVDNDYDNHACVDEDIRGNGDGNVILMCGPD